ncbi:methyltransferase [Pseudoclavibacter alba]|uniref:O-methyltransferase n=1 Tax=Pseudoclavibacter albus TaxID=272241 RepID=UPI0008264988|nr:hypothetical protein [Pseudoclavibacter alba]MBN6777635.1 methyltransferase [Pseudoclavibacter alba]
MSDLELNARYLDEQVQESSVQFAARRRALELGFRPVSPLAGRHLAGVAAMCRSRHILEIGGGIGTSALWLRRGAPDANLTILEAGADHAAEARRALLASGARPSQLRIISGADTDVLARMSDAGYDLVVLADDAPRFPARLQHALRLIRNGGTIVALGAMRGSAVASPARRDRLTMDFRDIISELERHPDFVVSILPIEGGILHLTKRS